MTLKTITTLFLAIGFAGICSAQKKKSKDSPVPVAQPVFSTQLDSVSYALGVMVATDFKKAGISSLNYTLLSKAMEDVLKDAPTLLSTEKGREIVNAFVGSIAKVRNAKNVEEGGKFLTQNKLRKEVIALPSGLQYEIIQQGNGPKPLATDEVTVHYKGSLLNGTTFDSSYDRKTPLIIKLDQVIKGWTEGVPLMNTGSKYRFYIPSDLAYGEAGAGASIPPNSVLIFDVELLKIGK